MEISSSFKHSTELLLKNLNKTEPNLVRETCLLVVYVCVFDHMSTAPVSDKLPVQTGNAFLGVCSSVWDCVCFCVETDNRPVMVPSNSYVWNATHFLWYYNSAPVRFMMTICCLATDLILLLVLSNGLALFEEKYLVKTITS